MNLTAARLAALAADHELTDRFDGYAVVLHVLEPDVYHLVGYTRLPKAAVWATTDLTTSHAPEGTRFEAMLGDRAARLHTPPPRPDWTRMTPEDFGHTPAPAAPAEHDGGTLDLLAELPR